MKTQLKLKILKRINLFVIVVTSLGFVFMFSTGFVETKSTMTKIKDIIHSSSQKRNRSKVTSLNLDSIIIRDKLFKFSAMDSTKISKDKSIITLYGNAKFECELFTMQADEITFNKNSLKLTVKNFIMYNKESRVKTESVNGSFSVVSN